MTEPDDDEECEYWDLIAALDEDPETDEAVEADEDDDSADWRNGWPPKA